MTSVFTTHKYEHQGSEHTGYQRVGHIEWTNQGQVLGKIYLNGPTQPPLILLRDEPIDEKFWETKP